MLYQKKSQSFGMILRTALCLFFGSQLWAQERIELQMPASANRIGTEIGVRHNYGGISAQNSSGQLGMRFSYGHTPNTANGLVARGTGYVSGGVPTHDPRTVIAGQALQMWLSFSRNAEWGGYGLALGEETTLNPVSFFPTLLTIGLCGNSAFNQNAHVRTQNLFFVCIHGFAGVRTERDLTDLGFAMGYGLQSGLSLLLGRSHQRIDIDARVRIVNFYNNASATTPANGNAVLETQLEVAVPLTDGRRLVEAFLQFNSEHLIAYGTRSTGSVLPSVSPGVRQDTQSVSGSAGVQLSY